jgi:hypothetical protein
MNAIAQMTPEAMARIIGRTAEKYDISLEAMRQAFPTRPTTEAEYMAIAKWMQAQYEGKLAMVNEVRGTEQSTSINPPRPSSPQVVADGYFAIPAGELGFSKPHFFRLHHGAKNGKWANTQFLKEQASDETYPVRGARKTEVLAYLAKHSDEARALYGTLISRCSRCNRTLTDHDNPYFPMYGPECGGK